MSRNLNKLLQSSKPTTKMKLLNVQLRPEVHAAFKDACKDTGHPMSDYIEAMILDFIQDQMLKNQLNKTAKATGGE